MTRLGFAIWRLISLSWTDRWCFMCAYARLARVSLVLRLVGPRRIFDQNRRAASARQNVVSACDLDWARLRARWVSSAARWQLLPAHCLEQSVVLHQWLHEDGIPSDLRIGVRKDAGHLKAHAWVELGGKVVNDNAAAVAAFRPLREVQGYPGGSGRRAHPTFVSDGQPPAWGSQ